jgi:S1-C subfamily serine protease
MNAPLRLLHSVLPSSVGLRVLVDPEHPSAAVLGTERLGSGTVINADGLVLTVNYVVLGASSIEVTLCDGRQYAGETVAHDFFTGLAALRIPGGPHASAQADGGAAGLSLGQDVFVVASTGGTERRTYDGSVTSLDPFDAFWEYHLERAIVTTAPNPGLGGGGLFTRSGTLAGVVFLDLAEIGRLTLAIPAEQFFEHREELLRHGRRVTRPAPAWIGFYCHVLRNHVVIAGLLPGAPGEGAGLKPGDVILSVDGTGVSERRTLYAHLWTRRPGDIIQFRVFRNDRVREVAVRAGDADEFFA